MIFVACSKTDYINITNTHSNSIYMYRSIYVLFNILFNNYIINQTYYFVCVKRALKY